ncbi:MAG TPA: nuclear transport factor 2 family protein [Pirellulales bacterium]|jgi:ketosteroid isomerase-like protein|nr:nuclear transport factor 2 family protein [Pirellulales bacterium]
MQTKKLLLRAFTFLAVVAACFASRVASADETKPAPADDAATILVEETQVIVPASNPADDTEAVERATLEFYAGLNALFTGDVAPMQAVWSHADDVTYMGPVGGYQVGWPQVNDRWEQQAALHLGGKIEPQDIRIVVGDALASVQCVEVGSNRFADGELEKVSIRATSLFRKENGQWKMIGHHTDLLPQLDSDSDETSEFAPDNSAEITPDGNSDVAPDTKSID